MLFHLTSELAKPLAKHLNRLSITTDPHKADLFWKADIAMIGTEPCIVAQEQNTLYVMIFCGLEQEDFDNFPQLFRDRFWRELAAICQQADLYDPQTLVEALSGLCDEQQYQMNPEPIEDGKIPGTFEKLQRRFLYDHTPLPIEGRDAFEFTFAINSRRPKSSSQNTQTPAEELGNICLNLIEQSLELKQIQQAEALKQKAVEAVISEKDNIVQVDFSRNKKR